MVSVVAGFSCLGNAVATAGSFTAVGTAVVFHLVAVVAFFPKGSDSVTTGRCFAGIGAVVFVDQVTVITDLVAVVPRVAVPSSDPIAADCGNTAIAAAIVVLTVAIVTGFACLLDGVATAG